MDLSQLGLDRTGMGTSSPSVLPGLCMQITGLSAGGRDLGFSFQQIVLEHLTGF